METVNGTSKEDTGRRYDYLRCQDEQNSLGQSREHGGVSRSREQSRSTANDSQWRNSTGQYAYEGDTPAGKILQRLELVEKSHTEYVRAHQTRLKARLNESEQLEEIFNQAVNELRQEIYNLATEAESNGNGHLNGTT
jgi:hypothetical protein